MLKETLVAGLDGPEPSFTAPDAIFQPAEPKEYVEAQPAPSPAQLAQPAPLLVSHQPLPANVRIVPAAAGAPGQPLFVLQPPLFMPQPAVPVQQGNLNPLVSTPYSTVYTRKRHERESLRGDTPTPKRTYSRTKMHNDCSRCGQPSQKETGHLRAFRKVYCPKTETLPFDEWKQKLEKEIKKLP
jgi:hypothetical protein